MKKVLILLVLICLALPVFATNWVEFSYKSYYDEDTWQQKGNYVIVWFKILNNNDIPLQKNKKVWYVQSRMIADCGNYKIAPLSSSYYDLQGKLIDSFDFDSQKYYSYQSWLSSLSWMNVAPDTMGMEKYNLMCSIR